MTTIESTGPVTVPEITVRRLAPPMPADGWWSWAATGVVVLIGAVLRLFRLDQPHGQIFDEVYYAVDAHHLLQHGVEWDDKAGTGSFVVHPPLGKWLIAAGEWLFGYNDLGLADPVGAGRHRGRARAHQTGQTPVPIHRAGLRRRAADGPGR